MRPCLALFCAAASPLHLDGGRDEFRGSIFGIGFAAMRGAEKEQAEFAINQGSVEFEQRCKLDERAKLRNSAGLENKVAR